MIDLSKRSQKKEMLDSDDIPFHLIAANMKELNIINTLLGGHAITIAGVHRLIGNRKEINICEIGCGGGDNLYAINKYCKKNNITASYIGIDLKPECISYARTKYPSLNCTWVAADYRAAKFPKPDIMFNSLFCHHFNNEELKDMMGWMHSNSKLGFFVNDLHRHWLAYYSIGWITKIFSKSALVKHDAKLSVARAFKQNELADIVRNAGLQKFDLQWKWAFRFLLVVTHAN